MDLKFEDWSFMPTGDDEEIKLKRLFGEARREHLDSENKFRVQVEKSFQYLIFKISKLKGQIKDLKSGKSNEKMIKENERLQEIIDKEREAFSRKEKEFDEITDELRKQVKQINARLI